MEEFDKIYLVWRNGPGSRRHAVGTLEETPSNTYVFKYLPEAEDLINKEGFTPYTEFQDLHKTYNGNVTEIFAQRLVKIDRPDSKAFFDFWEVDRDKLFDKFYLLGKTQGLVATDNFEFLAEYKLTDHTHFLTEIAGLSSQKPLQRGEVKIGDRLTFELEPTNEKDTDAVKVFLADRQIGYIKRYHNKIFHQPGAEALKLTVKALDQNGVIKRIFVKVSL